MLSTESDASRRRDFTRSIRARMISSRTVVFNTSLKWSSSSRRETWRDSARSPTENAALAFSRMNDSARSTSGSCACRERLDCRVTMPAKPYVMRTVSRRSSSPRMARARSSAALNPACSGSMRTDDSCGVVVSQINSSLSHERTASSCGTDMPASRQMSKTCLPRTSFATNSAVGLGKADSQLPSSRCSRPASRFTDSDGMRYQAHVNPALRTVAANALPRALDHGASWISPT